jgi:hypothetical protein
LGLLGEVGRRLEAGRVAELGESGLELVVVLVKVGLEVGEVGKLLAESCGVGRERMDAVSESEGLELLAVGVK